MVEICDVSAFWLLWIMLLLTFVCTFLFKHLFSIVLSLHPGVELPGHMVTLCLTYWGTVFSFLDFLLKEASTHVISFLNGSRPSGVGAGIFGIRVFWGDMDILPSVTAATGRESCMRCCPRGEPCSILQAVELWALTARHPLFRAVRTVSCGSAQGRYIFFDCLKCCISLGRNHRFSEKEEDYTTSGPSFKKHYKFWNPTCSTQISRCVLLWVQNGNILAGKELSFNFASSQVVLELAPPQSSFGLEKPTWISRGVGAGIQLALLRLTW